MSDAMRDAEQQGNSDMDGMIDETGLTHPQPDSDSLSTDQTANPVSEMQAGEQLEGDELASGELGKEGHLDQPPAVDSESHLSIDIAEPSISKEVQEVDFAALPLQSTLPSGEQKGIRLLMDVPLQVAVELGRTKLTVREVLNLQNGSVVELDRMAGDEVDIFVNERLLARGEVVVVDDKFGVRINELVSPDIAAEFIK
jgi:flagellar motor switch protein FliN